MKIADLTVEQFTFLVEDIIDRKLEEYFGDPDEGLELHPEFIEKLKASKRSKFVRIPMEQLCKELGIKIEEP
jgi:hypothetical protein